MARDDDDNDGLPPIGEGTETCLDDAKKGKPRYFLLICKGSKVKYLKVKKKQIKPAEIAEAKKLGYKGDAYIGVLTGQGMDLVFNLAISDGYETEPVRDSLLKDFLEQHVGFKCKPSFAIVSVPPEIPFDAEDLSHPLVARFLALSDQISQVLDIKPEAVTELSQLTSTIRRLLQDFDFINAEPNVAELERRLRELLGADSSDGGVTDNNNDALKQKLQEALNKLVPQIKQAVTNFPDRKAEFLKTVADVKQQLETNDLQAAKASILGIGSILKLLGSSTTTQPPVDPVRSEYLTKLATVQLLYDQALQRSLGDTSKFRTVMAYALEQAEAGVYANSIKALDRLLSALELVVSPPGERVEQESVENNGEDAAESDFEAEEQSAISVFKLGKARIEWQGTRLVALREIQRLRTLLLEEYGEDLESKEVLEATFAHLDFIINSLNEELGERLDDILNASGPERLDLVPAALKVLERFVGFVDEDETLKLIDGNEYAPDMIVAQPLKDKLDAISKALGVNN